MATASSSSSPNSSSSRNLIPSLTLLFVFLTAVVLGSPSMAASESQTRLIPHSLNNPPRKHRLESESGGRRPRDDRPLESAVFEVTSGTNHVLNNPPRKQRSDSESGGRGRRNDRDSNSPPRQQSLDKKSGGQRRDDSRFESAAHEVPSGPNPISN
ncbi:uncharacterized protein LOC111437389 [Cucurbita moschata]|uniref:Uncharacterized protein LOC111437389 n=1 Tax=Cucurbita moschata TaxID=3662 RepID=A0A6J1EXF7_CUCMO|nr:uncharacterized protein LOC111437389 [Cucurbita moschata]